MRTRRAALAGTPTLVLAALILVASCANGPSPQAWASAVCEALTPWRAEIRNLTTSTQQQMTAQTTPAQAKENLVRLFAGAERASETARRAVERAGIPDADGGETVSREFQASLAVMRDAYRRARVSIEGLAITYPTEFYQGVKAAVDRLNTEYNAGALDTSKLNSKELKQAFDEVPECR